MKTAIMSAIGVISYEDRPMPVPKADEVLVKLEYVGICGSDMRFLNDGRIGDFVVDLPFVLGHEPGGTVVEVGSAVKHLKPGDKVALEPGRFCRVCEACVQGKYNLCPETKFFGCPPDDGVFCEYVAHGVSGCHKLPDNVNTLEGAMIEPLAVGFHAANLANAKYGQTAAVFGCGCIGLTAMMALKFMGISRVYMVDFLENRIEMANKLGADYVVNFKKEDPVKKILELTHNEGVDVIIEASGGDETVGQAVSIGKHGAAVALVGYTDSGNTTIPLSRAISKEISFHSVHRYRHVYPPAIEAVAAGKVNLKDMVTHQFSFDELALGIKRAHTEKDKIVKAVIKF